MALPPLASVAALDAWLPGVVIVGDDAAEERAEAVLAAASAYVRAENGKTWTDEDDELVDDIPDAVSVLVVQLAARMWANPTGLTQEAAGPFSATHGRGTLTDDERGVLADNAAGGLGSIQVVAPAGTRFTGYDEDWDQIIESDTGS
jgi:hypothetical protein